MPLEIDDVSIRIIGNNYKALQFYDDERALQQEIYLQSDNTLNIGGDGGGGGGGGGIDVHALDGASHTGALGNAQAPQFLLLSGARVMIGDLDMGGYAITNVGNVDGVDVRAHAARHASGGGDAVDHDTLTNFLANEHINHTSVILTAGDGLDGGGDISASRTFDVDVTDFIDTSYGLTESSNDIRVNLGTGLTFSSGTIVLSWSGTPTTILPDASAAGGSSSYAARTDHTHAISCAAPSSNLSVSSTNAEGTGSNFARAAHTHAITSSSNPGAAASLLASSAAGYLQLVRLGAGVSPSYPLHAQSTGEQLRLQYDASNYTQFIVNSSGGIEIASTGDIVLDPAGNDVLPGSTVADDLGDYNRMWRTLFASELYVETLVAQDVMATIGGRVMVAPTTKLTNDMTSVTPVMICEHNNLAVNDFVLLKSAPGGVAQIEVMQVYSGPLGSGPYTYAVTRDEDGSGANSWVTGDAVVCLGYAAGEGYIELTSTSTIHSDLGPNITIYTRDGTANWDDVAPTCAIGNLESFVDYSSYDVGFAIGNDLALTPATGFRGLTADITDGLRLFNVGLEMYDGTDLRIQADPTATGTSALLWAGTSASDKRFVVTGDGDVWLSTLAISEDLGQSLFSLADGLMLFGPGCEISSTEWVSTRGQAATISGAFHQVAGRWAESRALVVEEATTNLCTNPSLETNTTKWANWSGGSVSQSTDGSMFGNYSLKVVTPGSDTDEGGYYNHGSALSASTEYTVSVWVFAPSGSTMRLSVNDAAGSNTEKTFTANGQWQRISTQHTTDASTTRFWAIVHTRSSAQAITFYVDGLQIEQKSYATTYCDGSLGYGYSWSGTAHASASTRTATEVNLDDHAVLISGNDTLSFSMWIQAQYDADGTWPRGSGYNLVFDSYDSSSSGRLALAYDETDDKWTFYANGAEIFQSSLQTFSAGDWMHIVLTIDFSANEYVLYINGMEDSSDTTSLSAPTLTQFNIGSSYAATFRPGVSFSEFAIFDRVLTADESAAIYASGKPIADMGALKRPGVYILDGDFRLSSSTSGIRTDISAPGMGVYDGAGTTGIGRVLVGLVDTSTYELDETASDLGIFGVNSSDDIQVALYASGTYEGMLVAGGGIVRMNEDGVEVEISSSLDDLNAYKFVTSGGDTAGGMYGYESAIRYLSISAAEPTSKACQAELLANAQATYAAAAILGASSGSASNLLYVVSDSDGSSYVSIEEPLRIYNGTVPSASVTDGVILYSEDVSSSAELKVRDEAGNITVLSPHCFGLIPDGPSEPLAWAHYGEIDGKAINVDMLKLVRLVERISGEKLVYIGEVA